MRRVIRVALWIALILVTGLAIAVRFRYGGGDPYPDLTGDPILGSEELETVLLPLGRQFEIGFGGRVLFQYAPDVARAFIAASRSSPEGAQTYNLDGTLASVDTFIETPERELPRAAQLVRSSDTPDRPRATGLLPRLRNRTPIPVRCVTNQVMAVATSMVMIGAGMENGGFQSEYWRSQSGARPPGRGKR